MTTALKPGKGVFRQVPSAAHDARKTQAMIVGIENIGVGLILIRPKGTRRPKTVTVDALWSILVKAEIREKQLEKARNKKLGKGAGKRSK